MRIAFICPYSVSVPGGVQNHVLGLAHWLGGRGHETHVLAPGELPPAVAARHHRVRITSAGPALGIAFNGSVARVRFGPRTAARVRQWMADVDPDILHLHEPVTPSIGLTGLLSTHAPKVVTYHTANARPGVMRAARSLLSAPLRRVDVHLAVSEAARVVAADRPEVPIRIVPNGFFPDDFQPSDLLAEARLSLSGRQREDERPWRGGRRPVIGFLGRLNEPRKGLATLVDAWPAIRRFWPEARVVVAGAGERSLPADWQALGPISDPDRARFLAECDVFVAPHLGGESFGLVLVEALAAGANVVASDIPAFADVLRGGSRTTFRVGDPDALASAVDATLTAVAMSGRPDAFADAGRAFAARYAWDVVGPRIEAAYADALGRSRQPDALATIT